MIRIVALVPDLMDRSRLRAPGVVVEFMTVADLAGVSGADLMVVDLSRLPGSTDLTGSADHIVGFAPHVDDEAMTRGRSAGCTTVMTRSRFFRRFPDLGGPSGPADDG